MAKKMTEKQLFTAKNEYLSTYFEKVTPYQFYRDIFPLGTLERSGYPEDRKPNAIFTAAYKKKNIDENDKKTHYARNTIVFDELAGLKELLSTSNEDNCEFVIASPVAYFGKNKGAENAYKLHGMTFDLDGVGMEQIGDLIHQIENDLQPKPTYIVNSGHGVHLYYLFEEPIPLYKHLYEPLNTLKQRLTMRIWNKYTSYLPTEKRQFQGIFQGFRMVGSRSKLGKRYPVTAFSFGDKVTLDYLNGFVDEKYKVILDEPNAYRLTLAEAKEKYPEWYEKRIVNGVKPGRWTNKPDLYNWWTRQIRAGAFEGNRYHCIATLFSYAVKCGIPEEKVLNDALELVPELNQLTKSTDNDFTVQDVYDACTFYSDSYVRFSINAIVAKTRIPIEKNKRNYRKQKTHLRLARANRDILCEEKGRDWREGNGRPKGSGTAEKKVREYRLEHPEATKADCRRATGLDPKTIRKWWNSTPVSKPSTEPIKFYRYTPTGVEEYNPEEFNPNKQISDMQRKQLLNRLKKISGNK